NLQAEQLAHGAQRVDLAVLDHRRGARPGGVAHLVAAGILVFPEDFAVRFVEAQDAVLARDHIAGKTTLGVRGPLIQDAVGDEDLAARHRRSRVTDADLRAPADRRAFLGKLLQDTGLAPDAVALRTEPLRPIVGMDSGQR